MLNRTLGLLILLVLLIGGGIWYAKRQIDPPVDTIVASSLESLHEQNQLSAFAARFVTVVTSRKEQLGFAAEKTLIVPAMVRYQVDLSKLTREDVMWDAASRTLSVKLPPVGISGPEFALEQTREYGSGAVLMALTDVEQVLDRENRDKARADVLKQAQAATMLRLAQDATKRAVAQSFALPLAATGIDAKVEVEFAK